MTSAGGFLGFFVLEASEYVEELDALVGAGTTESPPSAQAVQRIARALRGTATMARLTPLAELASAVERVGGALHERTLGWEPALRGALVAAVDDLKILLHSARSWSAADDERAASRTAELSRFAPVTRTATATSGSGTLYIATEAANVAAGLELLITRPADAATAADVLRRVRALRGVATVREITLLADVLEATEEATRLLEVKSEPLSAEASEVLGASASLLRHLASVLRDGGDTDAESGERHRFAAAYEQWNDRHYERERVVPISELFFSGDASGVVESAEHPPTSMMERFRLELVSQGEHLRGVLTAVRAASDPISVKRTRRELRRGLRSLQATAASYGEPAVAEFIAGHVVGVDNIDVTGLEALERFASLLAGGAADGGGGRLMDQLHSLTRPPAVVADRDKPSQSNAFFDAIDLSIAALDHLSSQPFSEPVPITEDLVPIETLLYRGRAALDRAVEIRDELRRRHPSPSPSSDPVALEELFDLLELARAE